MIRKNGFTLTELLVSIGIVGIVSAAITSLFLTSNEIYSTQEQIVRLNQDIRATLAIMSRNIRMVGLNPTGKATNAGFIHANATSLRFMFDYNAIGSCDKDFDYIFKHDEEAIKVQSNGKGGFHLLADKVSSLQFIYTLSDASTTQNPSNLGSIRFVTVNLCGKISGQYSGKYNNELCMNSTIRCRNLGM